MNSLHATDPSCSAEAARCPAPARIEHPLCTLYGFASVFKEKDVTDCCLSFCPAVFVFFLFQIYSLERECLPERGRAGGEGGAPRTARSLELEAGSLSRPEVRTWAGKLRGRCLTDGSSLAPLMRFLPGVCRRSKTQLGPDHENPQILLNLELH